ncbi:MAG: TetR/AcrR family transcriptional regulator [Oscillospiraceae bacterium]|nr:TetR/AcrR family transcriptional regulator [Oscillospiraceae bacterium]
MSVADKKLAKKIKLIDVAYDLFTSKGVNITPIDDVVKLAGVAKGTFYLYFKDKYDLLDQIIISRSEAMVFDALNLLEKESENREMQPAEKLIFFTDNIMDMLNENEEFVSLIQKNLPAFQSLAVVGENSKLLDGSKKLIEIFTDGGFSEIDAQKYLYLLTTMVVSAGCNSILNPESLSIDEIKPNIHYIINCIFRK